MERAGEKRELCLLLAHPPSLSLSPTHTHTHSRSLTHSHTLSLTHPTSYTLHPTPYTLTPASLQKKTGKIGAGDGAGGREARAVPPHHPTYTLTSNNLQFNLKPLTLNPEPYSQHPAPTPHNPHPTPHTLHPNPRRPSPPLTPAALFFSNRKDRDGRWSVRARSGSCASAPSATGSTPR